MKENPSKFPPRWFLAYGIPETYSPTIARDWQMIQLCLRPDCRNFRSVNATRGKYLYHYVRVHEASPEQVAAWALGWRPPKEYRRP